MASPALTRRRLAEGLPEFWSPDSGWTPEFLHRNLEMDIARREIDIGVRNRRPDQPWLAGRRTAGVDCVVYARDGGVTGWIGATDDSAATRSARWVATTTAARS